MKLYVLIYQLDLESYVDCKLFREFENLFDFAHRIKPIKYSIKVKNLNLE